MKHVQGKASLLTFIEEILPLGEVPSVVPEKKIELVSNTYRRQDATKKRIRWIRAKIANSDKRNHDM